MFMGLFQKSEVGGLKRMLPQPGNRFISFVRANGREISVPWIVSMVVNPWGRATCHDSFVFVLFVFSLFLLIKSLTKRHKSVKTASPRRGEHATIRVSGLGTPYSTNSLFSEFFKEFSGVIFEVCETNCGSFWKCFGRILKGKTIYKTRKTYQNVIYYYLPV